MPERITRMIGEVMTAVGGGADAQPAEATVDVSERVLGGLQEFYLDGVVSFTVLGNILLFNDFIRISEKSPAVQEFTRKLREKGVRKVVLAEGITPEELTNLVTSLARSGGSPESSANVTVSVVGAPQGSERDVEAPATVVGALDQMRGLKDDVAKGGMLDLPGLEKVVISLVSSLEREPNVIKVRGENGLDEDSWVVHAGNVAVLSVFQAEPFGFGNQLLHDIAFAGLLHDIGTAFLPAEVRDESREFTEADWSAVKGHTISGAMFLAGHADAPQLAVIAAFEHHMKYDGSGYPETKRRSTLPNLASQIVAISDFCDALLAGGPHRRPLGIREVVGLLRELAGRDFNPILVNSFIKRLEQVKAF